MLFPVTSWAGAQRQPRLSVVAYDIGSARRAYRVRRVLSRLRCNGQYSVCELDLTIPQLRDLVAELSMLCDPNEDRLVSWRPGNERVMSLDGQGRLSTRTGFADESRFAPVSSVAQAHAGNFVICYDISDPRALLKIGARVGARSAAVQRSVYWMRGAADVLADLLRECAPYLGPGDRFWIYPLLSSAHLWRVEHAPSCIFPVTDAFRVGAPAVGGA